MTILAEWHVQESSVHGVVAIVEWPATRREVWLGGSLAQRHQVRSPSISDRSVCGLFPAATNADWKRASQPDSADTQG